MDLVVLEREIVLEIFYSSFFTYYLKGSRENLGSEIFNSIKFKF